MLPNTHGKANKNDFLSPLCLTNLICPWKCNPRSSLTTSKDCHSMTFYRLVAYLKPLGPVINQLLAPLSLDTLVDPRSNVITSKEDQPMISYSLVWHSKPVLLCLALRVWSWKKEDYLSSPTTSKIHQPIMSYRLVSNPKPAGPIIKKLLAPVIFELFSFEQEGSVQGKFDRQWQ